MVYDEVGDLVVTEIIVLSDLVVTEIIVLSDQLVSRKEKRMPLALFLELEKSKQERIIGEALHEFATYGYHNSSTNRIVRAAQIGKGSLFKYFQNKEQLYFDVIDYVTNDLIGEMKRNLDSLPRDIFDRIIAYCQFEMAWHIKNPESYKLLKEAFGNKEDVLYTKLMDKYGPLSEGLFSQLLKDSDVSQIKGEPQQAMNILKWFLEGFNQAFFEAINPTDNLQDINKRYLKTLRSYMDIIKEGIGV